MLKDIFIKAAENHFANSDRIAVAIVFNAIALLTEELVWSYTRKKDLDVLWYRHQSYVAFIAERPAATVAINPLS